MEQYAREIIELILVGFVAWLARETHANGRMLLVIRNRLFGDEQEQDGGIAGDVKRLRTTAHDHANKLHEHGLRLENVEKRVTRIEVEDE